MADVVISEFMDAPAVGRLRAQRSGLCDADLQDLGEASTGTAPATRARIVRTRTRADRALLDEAAIAAEVVRVLGRG